jgi:phenylpropionate dioxygenase-like ring-hydroxylating dioxygenase large terminal subunit
MRTEPTLKSLRQIDGELIKHWYILALDREVPAKTPIRRVLYDRAYVLFRDSNGDVKVLLDRCPHRGSQLSEGKIQSGQLVCPYHGWKFNGAGQLTAVPSDGPVASEDSARKPKCAIAPPLVVQDGCVWIWPHESQPETERPPWRFPFADDPRAKSYFMITDFENETDHLVQNFMDVPHTVFVHSKWFRNKTMLQVPVDIEVGNARVKVTYHQKNDSIGFTDYLLNPRKEEMVHTDEFIFPNITRVDYGFGKNFFVINSQCSPLSRYNTRVYTWIAFDLGLATLPLLPLLKFYTRKVISQDVDIMKNQGDNLQFFERVGAPAPVWRSTGADELHLAIDRLRNAGRQGPKDVFELTMKREREFWI